MTISHLSNRFLLRQMDIVCEHCDSLSFPSEKFNCCHNGKVSLDELPFPPQLQNLYQSDSDFAKNFRSNIRRINTAFAFASHQAKLDTPAGTASPPPTFFSEFMGKYTTVTHLCTLITTIHPVSISCIYISPHKQTIIVFSILSLVAAGRMCWRSSPISYTTTTPMLVHIEICTKSRLKNPCERMNRVYPF